MVRGPTPRRVRTSGPRPCRRPGAGSATCARTGTAPDRSCRRAESAPKCGSRSTPGAAARRVVPLPAASATNHRGVSPEPSAVSRSRRRRTGGRRTWRPPPAGLAQPDPQRGVHQRPVEVAVPLVGKTDGAVDLEPGLVGDDVHLAHGRGAGGRLDRVEGEGAHEGGTQVVVAQLEPGLGQGQGLDRHEQGERVRHRHDPLSASLARVGSGAAQGRATRLARRRWQ